MAVELVCTETECDSGVDGSRWTTQPLTEQLAIQILDRHLLIVHGHQVQQAGGGGLLLLKAGPRWEGQLHQPPSGGDWVPGKGEGY